MVQYHAEGGSGTFPLLRPSRTTVQTAAPQTFPGAHSWVQVCWGTNTAPRVPLRPLGQGHTHHHTELHPAYLSAARVLLGDEQRYHGPKLLALLTHILYNICRKCSVIPCLPVRPHTRPETCPGKATALPNQAGKPWCLVGACL